jgi:ankyrin repeat protein
MDDAVLAAMNGHEAVVQLLLERGTYVDTKAAVRLQLYKGAEVNTKTRGSTALHAAAWKVYTALVQLLRTRERMLMQRLKWKKGSVLGDRKWVRGGCTIAVRQESRC